MMERHWTATVEAARRGETGAFEELVRRFQDRAFAVALANLGNYHQAEDAVQEAFVEAYRRLTQLDAPQAFPAWLHRIVLGKCVRLVRGGKSAVAALPMEALLSAPNPSPGPESVALESATRQVLREAMSALTEQEREALLLFAIGGYRYGEVAEAMELPLGTVKKRIYTARQRLRSAETLSALRPSRREHLVQRVRQRAEARQEERKEEAMTEIPPDAVTLAGPGEEIRHVVKNLYAFYRYELMPYIAGEPRVPPDAATEESWTSGAWVNRHGVLNGLHSATHDEGVKGEDGLWEAPNLQAYLIQLNGWPAGFACVASPPNATKGVDYRLQEFFVLNKARRRGVGMRAARLLFDRLPGRWELAYDPQNLPATAFWRAFLPAYTGGDFAEEMIGMGWCPDMPGYVFTRGPRPAHPIRVR